MYITLYNEDIKSHILTMNFLRSKKVEFVMKDQYFFIKQETYDLLQDTYKNVYLQSFESADPEVKYHMLANKLPVGVKLVSQVFEDYILQDYAAQSSLVIPESRYVFNGGSIGLFFQGSAIANPLDVLWKIATNFSYQQKYNAVFYDFVPVGQQMIYKVCFSFTGQNFTEKMHEVVQTKESVDGNILPLVEIGNNGFPEIYRSFERRYLSGNTATTTCQLQFVDSVVYLPVADDQIERVRSLIKGDGK